MKTRVLDLKFKFTNAKPMIYSQPNLKTMKDLIINFDIILKTLKTYLNLGYDSIGEHL